MTICSTWLATAATVIAAALVPAAARAGEVRILSGGAMKLLLEQVVPQFERASGHKVTLQFGPTQSQKKAIEDGVDFDLVLLPREVINELAQQGKVAGKAEAAAWGERELDPSDVLRCPRHRGAEQREPEQCSGARDPHDGDTCVRATATASPATTTQ